MTNRELIVKLINLPDEAQVIFTLGDSDDWSVNEVKLEDGPRGPWIRLF